jgi:chaperone modulatory protein CbpM
MKLRMRLTLQDAADKGGLAPDVIVRFVSYKWIVPADWEHEILDEEDVARARLIWELQNDLGVNDAAVPVILHLVDQLNCLYGKLRRSH